MINAETQEQQDRYFDVNIMNFHLNIVFTPCTLFPNIQREVNFGRVGSDCCSL